MLKGFAIVRVNKDLGKIKVRFVRGSEAEIWRKNRQPPPVFLPGEVAWTEWPGGLQFMGLQRVGQNLATKQQDNNRG